MILSAETVLLLGATVSVVSFFNLKILSRISEIKCSYESTYADVLRRLDAVELQLRQVQDCMTVSEVDDDDENH